MCLPCVLYRYNTTHYQLTGKATCFLMFSQKPKLPIDFLLARVKNPVSWSIHVVSGAISLFPIAVEGAKECF